MTKVDIGNHYENLNKIKKIIAGMKCFVLMCSSSKGDDLSVYLSQHEAESEMLKDLDTEIENLKEQGYEVRESYGTCRAELYVPDSNIYYEWEIKETTIQ